MPQPCERIDEDCKDPTISIIVATMNAATTLKECITSVCEQTYQAKELIIVDGGSTDGTLDIIKKHSNDIAHWQSEPDNGIYDAWNKGLARANGEWICFLGADDKFWTKDSLESFAPHLKTAYPKHRLVYGVLAVLNSDGSFFALVDRPWGKIKKFWTSRMLIPHPGALHHHRIFEEHGEFDNSFKIAGDYDLLLREMKSHEPLYVPGIVQAGYREGGLSSSSSTAIDTIKETRHALMKNGYGYPRYRFLWHCIWEVGKQLSKTTLLKLLGNSPLQRARLAYQRTFGIESRI